MTMFHASGGVNFVLASLKAIPKEKFLSTSEIIAGLVASTTVTAKVSIEQRKHWFTRRIYEYADVFDGTGKRIYESKQRVIPQKPYEPFY
ncbi:hypothetical protein D3C87_1253740 [compost metagenome]